MKRKSFAISVLIISLAFISYWGIQKFGKKEILYSTKSQKALTHYKSGVNFTLMYYIKEAKREFNLSIKEDPNFPLPYIYLISLSMGPKEGKIAEYYKKIAVPKQEWTNFEKEFTSIFMEFTSKRENIKGDKKFAKKLENFINRYADKVEIYPIVLPMYQRVVGDKNKLIEYYSYLHQKFPNNTQILNRLGYLYLEKRDYKNAENCFKKYIFIEPENANPYDSIADLYFSLGDYKKAAEKYKKALEIKPDFFNSQIKISFCYVYMGKLKLAEKILDKIGKHPSEIPYLKYSVYPLKAYVYYSERNIGKLKQLHENFNPPEKYRCFKVPVSVNYAILTKNKKLLSKALKEAEKCHQFIKDMVMPLKILELQWEGNYKEAEKLINNSLKNFNRLLYDKKIIFAHIITNYYISTKQYGKIKPILKYLKPEDKIYIEFLIAKARKNDKLCKEFAKKLLEYYNESDDNFYKKKEALECLK